jgi:predicted dehydrogenase
LQAELSHFINCVNGLATPRITGEDALNALRVIWQIQDALGFSRAITKVNNTIAA